MEETKKCPYCGKEILAIAKKCKHCGKWIEGNTPYHHKTKYKSFAIVAILLFLICGVVIYLKDASNNTTISETAVDSSTNEALERITKLLSGELAPEDRADSSLIAKTVFPSEIDSINKLLVKILPEQDEYLNRVGKKLHDPSLENDTIYSKIRYKVLELEAKLDVLLDLAFINKSGDGLMSVLQSIKDLEFSMIDIQVQISGLQSKYQSIIDKEWQKGQDVSESANENYKREYDVLNERLIQTFAQFSSLCKSSNNSKLIEFSNQEYKNYFSH